MTKMASLLIILVVVLTSESAVSATVKSNEYLDMGLTGKALPMDPIFELRPRSTLHCALLCELNECCETFTIDGDVCRGYGCAPLGMFLSTFGDAPGAQSFSKNLAMLDKGAHEPKDCLDAQPNMSESGEVTIYPEDDDAGLQVYCDHDPACKGWLVFQRRQDGSVDFYKDWIQYQQGFGSLNGEFWLGLETLHVLTSRQSYDLRVDLTMFNGTKGHGIFRNFTISNSSDNYRLRVGAFIEGNIGDALWWQSGNQFSTRDADHDNGTTHDCAYIHHGAWWYSDCVGANLNGRYMQSRQTGLEVMMWNHFDKAHSLKFSEMKIRPHRCLCCA